MSLMLLIVFGIPAVVFVGQVVGAVVGFLVTLMFHAVRGFLRHFVLGGIRKLALKERS
jgi:hypothetical protein